MLYHIEIFIEEIKVTIYIVVISILAGLFTFYMGYVDGTSAIASSLATHSLKPRLALFTCAISMFVAPLIIILLMGSDTVARTVGSLIETTAYSSVTPKAGFIFLISTLAAALLWAVISIILNVPNSVSHTLLGGLVGAGVIIFGFNSIDWNSVLIKVVLMVFLAPIVGLLIGYLLQKFFVWMCGAWPRAMKKAFKALQAINIVLLSISIAANNVQKSLGIYLIAMILCSGNSSITFESFEFVWWIVLIFAFLQCIGLFFGGENLITAVGYKLHKLSTVQSFVAQLATLIVSFAATFIGLPIATTQVVSSSIMGVGAAEGIRTVSWQKGEKMLISWIVTFPAAMLFGMGICALLKVIVL
jgi:inorganic phosphate transporter, PiT family